MATATKPPPSNNHEPQNPDTVDTKDDTNTDALLASLENESEEDSAYRASRIEQLNAEFASAQATAPPPPHPESQSTTSASALNSHYDNAYPTLSTDQSVLEFTTQTHRCVVHFAHPDFARCAVMDEHLRTLAARHYDVRFARVDVQNTPFVVEKLSIKVLPCVVGFCGGVGVERVVGFEGLGAGGKDGTDQF
ncbi:NTP binding protein, partial [Aspergillus sp. HF37]